MKKIANHSARKLVQSQTPFQGSNLFAEDKFNSYVVYSYGYHHPLYVYNRITKLWYANCDKYSRTTSKHAGQTHPHTDLRYGSTEALEKLIRSDDDSDTYESYPTKECNTKSRDPERETIKVVKIDSDNYRYLVTRGYYLSGRQHYIDTLPRYLQHKIALIKLSPPGAYIDGIGGRAETNVFVLNTNREN